MKSVAWNRQIAKDSRWNIQIGSQLFIIVMTVIILLVGVALGLFGIYVMILAIGVIIFALILLLRQNEAAAATLIAVHLYVDYYLGMYLVAGITTIVLLIILFLRRSPHHPWTKPRTLWIWIVLLILALFPMMRGISLADGFNYYFNVLFFALIMFWLGTIIAHNIASIRHLLSLLSFVGSFVAFVTILQYVTGTLLFSSTHHDAYLALSSDFELFSGDNIHRVGAYFLHPNPNGAFIAVMLCIAFGLFVESYSLRGKVFYLVEIAILLPALLFSYSTGACIAMIAGLVTFILFAGRGYYRILSSSLSFIGAICMIVLFPAQLDLLNQHTATANDLSSRMAAWQTGIAVVHSFPLTGLGFGYRVYIQRADPYRVWAQTEPLSHPHNSFIELAALGGVPISILFVLLLLLALWLALRNWAIADARSRSLIGTGIATAIALTSFSMGDTGWTLPPVLAIAWLILGAVSSPSITKHLQDEMKEKG